MRCWSSWKLARYWLAFFSFDLLSWLNSDRITQNIFDGCYSFDFHNFILIVINFKINTFSCRCAFSEFLFCFVLRLSSNFRFCHHFRWALWLTAFFKFYLFDFLSPFPCLTSSNHRIAHYFALSLQDFLFKFLPSALIQLLFGIVDRVGVRTAFRFLAFKDACAVEIKLNVSTWSVIGPSSTYALIIWYSLAVLHWRFLSDFFRRFLLA